MRLECIEQKLDKSAAEGDCLSAKEFLHIAGKCLIMHGELVCGCEFLQCDRLRVVAVLALSALQSTQ